MSSRTAQLKRDLTGWIWVSPWLFGFLVFLLGPMLVSLYYSFTDYPLLEPPIWTGLANYRRMLTDDTFRDVLWRTARFAILFIPLATALSLAIAGLLNERVKAGGFFQAAVFIPTLVPMAGSAMIWLWMLNGEYGLINQVIKAVLGWAGVTGPNWLADSRLAMASIVMISLWSIGQMVVVYLAALKEVPDEMLEAAALDGMGPIRRFISIVLPMISPVILFNVITLMIGALQIFAIPYIISAATPGGDPRSMYFYTMYMYDNGFRYGQMGYASAQAWVQLLITLGLTAVMFLASRKLVHYRS
ncbi:MAG: sugar ABC transporter permease [Phycisphaerales bacterium]|nr:sugar ABC transporter permease [Planctomycetota bacterium]